MKTLPMPRPLQATVKLFDLFRAAGTKPKPRDGCLSLSQDDVREVLGVMLLALGLERVEKMLREGPLPREADPHPLTGYMWNLLETRAARPLGPSSTTLSGLAARQPVDLETIEARAILSALTFWRERALVAEALRPLPDWNGDSLWLGALMLGEVVKAGRMWTWRSAVEGVSSSRLPMPKKAARAALYEAMVDALSQVPAP